jgi:hypothetical protein
MCQKLCEIVSHKQIGMKIVKNTQCQDQNSMWKIW